MPVYCLVVVVFALKDWISQPGFLNLHILLVNKHFHHHQCSGTLSIKTHETHSNPKILA